MNDKGVLVLLTAIIALSLLFPMPTKQDASSVQPTDGLVEQVQSVGNTMEEPKPIEQENPVRPAAKPEIIMFAGKSCPPCERWKKAEMQKFLDAGWSVGIVEVHRYPVTPRFEITSSQRVEHIGYLTFEQAKGLLK